MSKPVQELEGVILALWVARSDPRCEGLKFEHQSGRWVGVDKNAPHDVAIVITDGFIMDSIAAKKHAPFAEAYAPHAYWSQGGLIMDREKIGVIHRTVADEWIASIPYNEVGQRLTMTGPTALVAAMRAFVAMKQGDEVQEEEGGES